MQPGLSGPQRQELRHCGQSTSIPRWRIEATPRCRRKKVEVPQTEGSLCATYGRRGVSPLPSMPLWMPGSSLWEGDEEGRSSPCHVRRSGRSACTKQKMTNATTAAHTKHTPHWYPTLPCPVPAPRCATTALSNYGDYPTHTRSGERGGGGEREEERERGGHRTTPARRSFTRGLGSAFERLTTTPPTRRMWQYPRLPQSRALAPHDAYGPSPKQGHAVPRGRSPTHPRRSAPQDILRVGMQAPRKISLECFNEEVIPRTPSALLSRLNPILRQPTIGTAAVFYHRPRP